MLREFLIAIGLLSAPYTGMTIKEGSRLVFLEQQITRNPNFKDTALIHDRYYNPGTLNIDGSTTGKEGSQFEYLWHWYQNHKGNPNDMAKVEREAIRRGAR